MLFRSDKSNPATGDFAMIEVTAVVMVLSAAALLTMNELRKRNKI